MTPAAVCRAWQVAGVNGCSEASRVGSDEPNWSGAHFKVCIWKKKISKGNVGISKLWEEQLSSTPSCSSSSGWLFESGSAFVSAFLCSYVYTCIPTTKNHFETLFLDPISVCLSCVSLWNLNKHCTLQLNISPVLSFWLLLIFHCVNMPPSSFLC